MYPSVSTSQYIIAIPSVYCLSCVIAVAVRKNLSSLDTEQIRHNQQLVMSFKCHIMTMWLGIYMIVFNISTSYILYYIITTNQTSLMCETEPSEIQPQLRF